MVDTTLFPSVHEQLTDEKTVRTVDTKRFLRIATRERKWHDSYVRLFYNQTRQELRAYVDVSDEGDYENKFYRTIIKNVSGSYPSPFKSENTHTGNPIGWNFHAMSAEIFLTWLDSYNSHGGEKTVRFTYWQKNNSQAIEESSLDFESLTLTWENETDRRTTQIGETYHTESVMFGIWE